MPEDADDETLARAVAERTAPVRDLSIGLERLGSALAANQQAGEAVEIHRQVVLLGRALARVPEAAEDEA